MLRELSSQTAVLSEESVLSAEKEVAYRTKIAELSEKNASLSEEVADLRQQLALFKKALYAKNEKQYLYRFLENPEIPIDNNRAENAIRPFVVGRKNWLFCDSVKGAEASALFYSLAATATANNLNVEKYFIDLLSSKAQPVLPW